VLSDVEGIAADAEEAERGAGMSVRVGVSQTTAAEIMPSALQAFRIEHPGVEVVLSEIDDDAAVGDALGRGRLDLAFAINPEPDDRVEAVPVLDDPWVLLTRRDSAIAELERPGLEVLNGLDIVAWTRRWKGQRELEELWSLVGLAPRVVYRTDDNLALQRLVAAGLGHACIGRLAARRAVDPSLTWLLPRELLSPRRIALCYPRYRQLTATTRALIAAIRGQVAA
jgi:DNA-binding transcriptional LysR family regulator